MIKRITFVSRRAGVAASDLLPAWRAAAGAVPAAVRPVRSVLCTTLDDLDPPDARPDGVSIEWFATEGALEGAEAWLRSPAAAPLVVAIDDVVERGPVVVADEVVMRGADWLDERWRQGGPRLKHMAIARRAEGLTPAAFLEQWRGEAGQVRPAGAAAVAIPEDLRGRAYVQNHPLPRTTGEWAYDAINEVYLDDVDHVARRIDWFHRNLPEADGPLFRDTWSIAVTEDVLPTT